jgi:hypothetical protein
MFLQVCSKICTEESDLEDNTAKILMLGLNEIMYLIFPLQIAARTKVSLPSASQSSAVAHRARLIQIK